MPLVAVDSFSRRSYSLCYLRMGVYEGTGFHLGNIRISVYEGELLVRFRLSERVSPSIAVAVPLSDFYMQLWQTVYQEVVQHQRGIPHSFRGSVGAHYNRAGRVIRWSGTTSDEGPLEAMAA